MNGTGQFVTESLDFDGGRDVTVYVPAQPPKAIVYAGDGQLIARWGADLESADVPAVMIVGVHRNADETLRLHEYSPAFDPGRFAAHEQFLVDMVMPWVTSRWQVGARAESTAIAGVSASGELALALGLRHPELFGAVLCASPGAGFRPPGELAAFPRTYLVAGRQEPFFLDNATRWFDELRDARSDVVMTVRDGAHGDPFWRHEFPLMARWAFTNRQ